jgi:hypothetical protein
VTVAVAMGVVWGVTVLDDAGSAYLERSGRSRVTRLEDTPVVHLAMVTPPVDGSLASVDIAGSLHGVQGTGNEGQKILAPLGKRRSSRVAREDLAGP